MASSSSAAGTGTHFHGCIHEARLYKEYMLSSSCVCAALLIFFLQLAEEAQWTLTAQPLFAEF
jgi:hypothetical protein